MLYWVMKYVLLGPILRLFFRPKIEGLENVPAEGGALSARADMLLPLGFKVDRMTASEAGMPDIEPL